MSESRQRLYRTDAVVLRRQEFGEADRVLTLYSPFLGKFRAIAKGVRRPKSRLGGHVELFTDVNVLVAQGRNLDIVTQAETVRPFPGIRDDLWKTAYAAYAAELVDRFTAERQENAPIFELLVQYFEAVQAEPAPSVQPGESTLSLDLCARNFEMRLLRFLGYAPELYHCTDCQTRLTPGEQYFSAAEGGVLCATCADTHSGGRGISVNAIKVLRLLNEQPFGVHRRLRLPPETQREVETALRSHIQYILEKQLRTAEFLDRMKAEHRRNARLTAQGLQPSTPAPDAAPAPQLTHEAQLSPA